MREKQRISDIEWERHLEDIERFEEWKKAEEERKKAVEEYVRKEEERRSLAIRKARVERELDDEFEFYLQFVKSLVLYMHNIKERSSVSKWIIKLRDNTKQSALRIDYIKFLLFCLQRRHLYSMFADEPPDIKHLPSFPEGLKLEDMMRRVIAEEQARTDTGAWDLGLTVQTSSDLKEYVAVQKIPKYGAHFYMALSDDPLPQWNKFHCAPVPNYIREKCGLKRRKVRSRKSAAMLAKERRMKQKVKTKTRYEPAKVKRPITPKLTPHDILNMHWKPSYEPPSPEPEPSREPLRRLQPTRLIYSKPQPVKKTFSGREKKSQESRSSRHAKSTRRRRDEFSSTDQSAGDSQKESTSTTEVRQALRKYIETPHRSHPPPPPSRHSGDTRLTKLPKGPERSRSPNITGSSTTSSISRKGSSHSRRPERVKSEKSDLGGNSRLRRGGGTTTFQVYRMEVNNNNISSSAETSSSLTPGYNRVTTISPRRQRTGSSGYVTGTQNSEDTSTTGQKDKITTTTMPRRSSLRAQNHGVGLSRVRGDIGIASMMPRRPAIDSDNLDISSISEQEEDIENSSEAKQIQNDNLLIYAAKSPDHKFSEQDESDIKKKTKRNSLDKNQDSSTLLGTLFEDPPSRKKGSLELPILSGSTSLDPHTSSAHLGKDTAFIGHQRQVNSTSTPKRVDKPSMIFRTPPSEEKSSMITQRDKSTSVGDLIYVQPKPSSRQTVREKSPTAFEKDSSFESGKGQIYLWPPSYMHSDEPTSPTEHRSPSPSSVDTNFDGRSRTMSRQHSSGTKRMSSKGEIPKSMANKVDRRTTKELGQSQIRRQVKPASTGRREESQSSTPPRRSYLRTDSRQVRTQQNSSQNWEKIKANVRNGERTTSLPNRNDLQRKRTFTVVKMSEKEPTEDTKDSKTTDLNKPKEKSALKGILISVPTESAELRRVRPKPEEIIQKRESHLRPETEEIKRKETRIRPRTEELKKSAHSKTKSLAKKQASPPVINDFSSCIPSLEENEESTEDVEGSFKQSEGSIIIPDCYCYSKGYSEQERKCTKENATRDKRSAKDCGCSRNKVCLPPTCRQNEDFEKSEEVTKGIDQSYLNIEYDEMRGIDLVRFRDRDAPEGFRYYKFIPRGTISSPNFVISGLPRPIKHLPEDPEHYKWTKDQLRKPLSPPPSPPLTRPPSATPPPIFTFPEPKPIAYRRRLSPRESREIVGKLSDSLSSGGSVTSVCHGRPLIESSRARKSFSKRQYRDSAQGVSLSGSRTTLRSQGSSEPLRRSISGSRTSVRKYNNRTSVERVWPKESVGQKRDSRIRFDLEDKPPRQPLESGRSSSRIPRKSPSPRDSKTSRESRHTREPSSSRREHSSSRSQQSSGDRHESSRIQKESSPPRRTGESSSRRKGEPSRSHNESSSSRRTRESPSRHKGEPSRNEKESSRAKGESSRRKGETPSNNKGSSFSRRARDMCRSNKETAPSKRSRESSRNHKSPQSHKDKKSR